jgi:MoaA/NifB/PqqE/SkfB family radical SAM enzyme
VPGSFAQTVRAARWAAAAGLPLQINTLVCAETVLQRIVIYSTRLG